MKYRFCRDSAALCALALFSAAGPPATASATSVGFCVGDCNGDGAVTVDELIRGISIALGNRPLNDCPTFDPSDDGLVTVDEIVSAVANGLSGCPTPPTRTPTVPPTVPATVRPPEPFVEVLVTTGIPLGGSQAIVTSLGTPVISPLGYVFAVAQLTTEGSDVQDVLLRMTLFGDPEVVLSRENPIPGSSDTIESIGRIIARAGGVFALADSSSGSTLLLVGNDRSVQPLLGIGAPAARRDFEPRTYVVPLGGESVVTDVFTPQAQRAVVAVNVDGSGGPIPLVAPGDSVDYRDDDGALVSDIVTETFAIAAEDGAAVVDASLEVASQGQVNVTFDDSMRLGRNASLVRGTRPPGVEGGVTLVEVNGGVRIGYPVAGGTRGFLATLSEASRPGFNEAAAFLTDGGYSPLFVVRSGDPVPDMPGASVDVAFPPIMGTYAAAFWYFLVDAEENRSAAIAVVDYETRTFRTVVVAGQAAPDGGIFTDLQVSLAFTEDGQLFFLGRVDGVRSAYYAVSPAEGSLPRRVVGTGDEVMLPQGGTATITTLGLITEAGLSGGPAIVNDNQFTVSAALDQGTGAVLLVDIGDPPPQ
jgi:hypothetical protein